MSEVAKMIGAHGAVAASISKTLNDVANPDPLHLPGLISI